MSIPRELFVVICYKCGLVAPNTVRAIAEMDAKTHRTSKHSSYDKAEVTVGWYREAYTP